MSSDGLLSRIAALRTENTGGERFEREMTGALSAAHPDDLLYTLRWLYTEVDAGRHDLAVTLAPVTIDQFIDVCRQNRIMPPKSTWFQPKIRSGLVMALLG